ncbi:hypothetical protein DFP72DRAFT_482948 [Ephemerocybe angulata]|uniref:F-box domain-containing protein n=1 Tax=Ephemerocybe angulata TaxID=980116 RepID=A0A8H6IDV3_9AGAR|nr:hypothetical protein DFP72DRAFT_482948 [Tulosesus angulatus]
MDHIEATLDTLALTLEHVGSGDVATESSSDLPSYIEALPIELLIQIFEIVCSTDTNFLHLIVAKPKSLPPQAHTLIHVCRTWREIAMHLKSIWKHFVVVDTCPSRWRLRPHEIDAYERKFHEVASLYGANLTHLQFDYNEDFGVDRKGIRRLLKAVLQYSERYTTLKLVGDVFRASITVVNLPLLDELYLLCPRVESPKTITQFCAPKLRKLTLYSPRYYYSFIRLPWEQLTHLSFGVLYTPYPPDHPLSLHEFISLLQALSNLSHLHLTGPVYMVRQRPSLEGLGLSEPVLLPKLRVLEIHDRDAETLFGGSYSFFLTAIATPRLNTLDLIVAQDLINNPHPHFVDLLRRAPLLQRLRVVLAPIDWTGVRRGVWEERYLKMQGDAQFFETYVGDVGLDSEDVLTCDGTIVHHSTPLGPRDGTTTTEGFIDRCLDMDMGPKEHIVQRMRRGSRILAFFKRTLGSRYGVEGGERTIYIHIPIV